MREVWKALVVKVAEAASRKRDSPLYFSEIVVNTSLIFRAKLSTW
jgi:hypothetical protein